MIERTMKSTCVNISLPKYGALPLLLFLSLLCTSCQAEDKSIPSPTALRPTLIGKWQVTEVHTDQGESQWSLTRDDKYNIHKYLGREFEFTPQRLTTNAPEDKRCDEPKIIVHRTTAGKLVGTSIASRPFNPARPTPKDFQLPLSENTPVEVLSLLCKDGLFVKNLGGALDPNIGIDGAWFIILNKEQLALRWNDETLLILNRLPENAKPSASFDCTKAGNTAEKTICGSAALASYDQSVSQTYKLAMEYYKTKNNTAAQLTALKESQKQWLTLRNACNADKSCLEKSMGDRIVEIDYGISSYAYENR